MQKKAIGWWVLAAAWLAGGIPVWAMKAGDQAPDLAVPATGGREINLRDLQGQWVVLFFYPKAFTPGCTSQACGMRDANQDLMDLGVTVLGASTDTVKTQEEFKAKHQLPYDLLADHDKKLSRAFDALGLLGFNKRMTFIINPEGTVTDVIDSVSVGSHDADVIRMLKARMQAAE